MLTDNIKGVGMSTFVEGSQSRLLRPYLVYVLSFVGAGMVSGGVVHYPLNESFYGTLAIIGGLIFAVGSVANEILSGKGFPNFGKALSIIFSSLLLSFGIGMLSGGIQHFTDFPKRAAILVPSGIALSFLAFTVKSEVFKRGGSRKFLASAIFIVVLTFSSLIFLTKLASGMESTSHSHSNEQITPAIESDDHSNHPHPK